MAAYLTGSDLGDILIEAIEKYKNLKHQIDDLQSEVKKYRDDIETFMIDQGLEEAVVGPFKVSYKLVSTAKVDSKILERDFPDVYKQVAFASTTSRLTIS